MTKHADRCLVGSFGGELWWRETDGEEREEARRLWPDFGALVGSSRGRPAMPYKTS